VECAVGVGVELITFFGGLFVYVSSGYSYFVFLISSFALALIANAVFYVNRWLSRDAVTTLAMLAKRLPRKKRVILYGAGGLYLMAFGISAFLAFWFRASAVLSLVLLLGFGVWMEASRLSGKMWLLKMGLTRDVDC
jgi:hypothetical protein